jgi:hypothetical protein
MEGQLNSILEFNMEIELIEVDSDRMTFVLSIILKSIDISLKRQEIFRYRKSLKNPIDEFFSICYGLSRYVL